MKTYEPIVFLLVFLLAFALFCLIGCAAPSGQQAAITPASSTDAKVISEKIDQMTQNVSTFQQAVSNQVQNFKLDAERAKVQMADQKQAHRNDTVRMCQIMGLLLAFVVAMACARSVVPQAYRVYGYLAAIGIAAFMVMWPMIWPL